MAKRKKTKLRKSPRKTIKALKPQIKKIPPEIIFIPGFIKSYWKQCLLITLSIFAIYIQDLSYEYVLDDKIVILENSFTKSGLSGIPDILKTESFQGYFGMQRDLVQGARYRPMSIISFALEHQIFGLNPIVSHFLNILFYVLLCLLFYRIFKDLLKKYKSNIPFLDIGFLAVLLFAVHPLHTEVVANIKGRDEIFSLLFSLLALYYYLKFLDRTSWYFILTSGIMFFIGLLSKENTITFLAIIPLVGYFFTGHSIKRLAIATAPLVFFTAIYLILRFQIIGYLLNSGRPITELMNNPFVEMNVQEKFATIFYTLGLYLKLGFFPHPLTHDYYPYHIPIMNWGSWKVLISVILYFILGFTALFGLFKRRILSFAIIFFFCSLSISSNLFFTVGTFMNERFMFAPVFSFCLILAFLGESQFLDKFGQKIKAIPIIILGIIFIAFCIKSFTRVPVWENAFTLNSASIKVSKNSARANTFMATALYERAKLIDNTAEKLPLLQRADTLTNRAIEIHPNYSNAHLMRAGVLGEYYRINRDLDALLREFSKIALRKPVLPFLLEYYSYLNRTAPDVEKLISYYYKLGYHQFFQQRGDTSLSLRYLNFALELDSNRASVHQAMAQIYRSAGNIQQAEFHEQKVNSQK